MSKNPMVEINGIPQKWIFIFHMYPKWLPFFILSTTYHFNTNNKRPKPTVRIFLRFLRRLKAHADFIEKLKIYEWSRLEFADWLLRNAKCDTTRHALPNSELRWHRACLPTPYTAPPASGTLPIMTSHPAWGGSSFPRQPPTRQSLLSFPQRWLRYPRQSEPRTPAFLAMGLTQWREY